jgi:hypothetical protein
MCKLCVHRREDPQICPGSTCVLFVAMTSLLPLQGDLVRYAKKEVHCVISKCPFKPCHGSGGKPPAFHRGGPGSIPSQPMWDLWWTKWHWDRFFLSEYFGFLLSVSFHRCSISRKRTKNNHHHRHHRVAEEASRLRYPSPLKKSALLRFVVLSGGSPYKLIPFRK